MNLSNNKGRRNKAAQGISNSSHQNPYSNETENFFNESFNNQQNFYQPIVPTQQTQQQVQNGFYEMPANNNQAIYSNNIPIQNINMPQQFVPQQPKQQQQQPQQFFNPMQPNVNNFFSDPVASMAVQYGSSLAGQGKEYVSQNVNRWFSIAQLKYYFAVDTSYVTKKLLIILLPFINRDWSIKYSQAEPVPPKLDVNALDLYIPVMAFVTYILMVGVCLGIQEKFTPEQLGIQASSALGWFVIEVLLIFLLLQILSIKSALKTFDIMAFCGYKYFGMILCLLSSIAISSYVYNIVLIYMCIAITYFMVRYLKLMILTSHSDPSTGETNVYETTTGNKRRVYVLLFISFLQPLFMWWLTRHLVV